MNKEDRIIILFLTIGVWGVMGSIWLSTNNAAAETACKTNILSEKKHNHSTNEIAKFKWKVRRIVEDCSVTDEEILC